MGLQSDRLLLYVDEYATRDGKIVWVMGSRVCVLSRLCPTLVNICIQSCMVSDLDDQAQWEPLLAKLFQMLGNNGIQTSSRCDYSDDGNSHALVRLEHVYYFYCSVLVS